MISKIVAWFYIVLAVIYFFNTFINLLNVLIFKSGAFFIVALGYCLIGILFVVIGRKLLLNDKKAWYVAIGVTIAIYLLNKFIYFYMMREQFILYTIFQLWVIVILVAILLFDYKTYLAPAPVKQKKVATKSKKKSKK